MRNEGKGVEGGKGDLKDMALQVYRREEKTMSTSRRFSVWVRFTNIVKGTLSSMSAGTL